MLAVSLLSLQGSAQRLAALMPVESELEAEALNAWRQLVHVLTHEIMNSLTPVASLSRTARDMLEDCREALPPDVGHDLVTALDAISRRADSLADFVTSYRSLSNVPAARPERILVAGLFERVRALVSPAWRSRGGEVQFSVEPGSLELVADPGQLEQALINLLKNAFEASAGVARGGARVSARLVRGGRLRIEVADDGPGVPPDLVKHIFTPFFTTKKQGGGIGLGDGAPPGARERRHGALCAAGRRGRALHHQLLMRSSAKKAEGVVPKVFLNIAVKADWLA